MPPKSPVLTLTVQPPYLSALRAGFKTNEGRLARPQYLALHPGTHIKIKSTDSDDEASIFEVQQVTQHKTFREMLLAHGVKAFLPALEDADEAVEVYRGFPGYAEGETAVGVVAVELRLVEE